MLMTSQHDHVRMSFHLFHNTVDHIGISRVLDILRCTKYTAGNGINRTDHRQWNIHVGFCVGKRKDMLLEGEISSMWSITFKRMVRCQQDQFIEVAVEYLFEFAYYLVFSFVF